MERSSAHSPTNRSMKCPRPVSRIREWILAGGRLPISRIRELITGSVAKNEIGNSRARDRSDSIEAKQRERERNREERTSSELWKSCISCCSCCSCCCPSFHCDRTEMV
ncbi:hypothetical protein EUGRSUZ_I00229 [Eucalyptus grandis]|uniref:Uncharacterized protein n=2 Tax=Eucalyptus grandis TaxID=71139 RepID=A0ACC3JB61_EUCGR|nr:hypothetical protein EUGRSUZ_I00229 [Eucalyptus grandis]